MNNVRSFQGLVALQCKIVRKFGVTYTPNYVYHFYVDFKGLMYFDDTTPFVFPNAIKDRKFIEFFYRNIKKIQQQSFSGKKYQYVSQFWGERNYLRCAIAPIIFNYLNFEQQRLEFSLGQSCRFDPKQMKIDQNGLIWHPYIVELKATKKRQKVQQLQKESDRYPLMGVFSNELTTQILDDIVFEERKASFSYKEHVYLISEI